MQLSDQRKLSATECYICANAGKNQVLWPQEPVSPPEFIADMLDINDLSSNKIMSQRDADGGTWLSGSWRVYVRGKGHFSVVICAYHWNPLLYDWEYSAQLEVDQSRA